MYGLSTHHCFTAGPFTGYVEANRIIPKFTHPRRLIISLRLTIPKSHIMAVRRNL